jgi:hypothetical protein
LFKNKTNLPFCSAVAWYLPYFLPQKTLILTEEMLFNVEKSKTNPSL